MGRERGAVAGRANLGLVSVTFSIGAANDHARRAAFSSASASTYFRDADSLRRAQGLEVTTIGAKTSLGVRSRLERSGRLRAIIPERDFLGVAPGTGERNQQECYGSDAEK